MKLKLNNLNKKYKIRTELGNMSLKAMKDMKSAKREIAENPREWNVVCESKGHGYKGSEELFFNVETNMWKGKKFQIKIVEIEGRFGLFKNLVFSYENNMRVPIKLTKQDDCITFQINSRKDKTVCFVPTTLVL